MLTPKKTAFARYYHERGNASEAYRLAYNAENMKPQVIRQKAYELLQDGDVTVMLAQLGERAMKRHDYTVDSLSEILREAIALAKETKQPAAIVSASMAIGKLHGLIVEKREDVTKRDKHDFSDDELDRLIAEAKGLQADAPRSPRAQEREAPRPSELN